MFSRYIARCVFVALLVLSLAGIIVGSASASSVTLKFFYGETCPHCTHAKPFLRALEQKYENLTVEYYEVWYNSDNKAILQQTAAEHNIDVRGVPAFFIGDDHIIGYGGDETTGKQIEDFVKKYLGNGAADTKDAVALSDVNGSKYAIAIQNLVERKIVNGYADGTFKPKNTINRAEFLKILMEAKYPSQAAGGSCFADVALEWFARYVCFAKTNGIVNGYADGTFKPASNINHAEALKILTETFGFEVGETGGEWYQKYVNAAKANNFYLNSAAGASVTREEMAEMVYRILGA